jgi:uncharacterized protein DUF4394
MRLNFNWQILSAVAITGTLLFSACSQDDQAKPNDNQSIEERGLFTGVPVSTALIGLTDSNQLVSLMSGPPIVDMGLTPITGLRVDEYMRAIDTRPRTNELFGVSNQNTIYKIDKTTGLATPVGLNPLTPAVEGEHVGFDFSPVDDVIRLVTSSGQNMRISPVTGAVIAVDAPIASLSVAFNSSAYSTTVPGRPSALYNIDPATGALFRQTNPNGGQVALVGLTGFNFIGEGAFEITNTNSAFAVQFGKSRFQVGGGGILGTQDETTQDAYRLLLINLRSGVATSHGKVRPMIGLATR